MMRKSIIYFLLFFSQFQLLAQPKIGIALGGGGAKGAATIGALKVIEKAGIKIDYIAGTSVGAVIGGLYASGIGLDEIESFLLSHSNIKVLDSHKIERELDKIFVNQKCELVSRTCIPFQCVAVNYDTMEEVDISNGSLSKAVVASMSVPIVFEPVRFNQMDLYDGGLMNNLPVDVVRSMGADIVIAIDLQQSEQDAIPIPFLKIQGLFGKLAKWKKDRPDKDKYRSNRNSADIYIHPNLFGFGVTSRGIREFEAMKLKGEEEAMRHWDDLVKINNL